MSQRFKKVVIGGTFDLLHIGHKKLLEKTFESGEFVSIGLTTDEFNHHRGKKTFENQQRRQSHLTHFLTETYGGNFAIHLIDDVYGNADTDSALEAIIVTKDTYKNAVSINQHRRLNNLEALELITVDHAKDVNGNIISSTRIRNGEIDDQGIVMLDLVKQLANKPFPDTIKNQFKEPLGEVIHKLPDKIITPVITVGDITTQTFLQHNIIPNIAIIDLKTKRQKQFADLNEIGFQSAEPEITVQNPPGTVSSSLIEAILQKKSPILVEGEEDLAVIPAVLLSALGTHIYYGQPDQGIVKLLVTPELKKDLVQRLSLHVG